jgi:hypothetical protein
MGLKRKEFIKVPEKGSRQDLVFRSHSRLRREFTAGITLISESDAYLDVSFLALSEDKFLNWNKKADDYARFPEACQHGPVAGYMPQSKTFND